MQESKHHMALHKDVWFLCCYVSAKNRFRFEKFPAFVVKFYEALRKQIPEKGMAGKKS